MRRIRNAINPVEEFVFIRWESFASFEAHVRVIEVMHIAWHATFLCVRLEHPGLPDALKAGDLVATLWTTAQTQANETLTHFQAEAQIAATEAKLALMSGEADRETAIQSRQETQTAFDQANERIEALGLQAAATNATDAPLASQLQEAKAEISLRTRRNRHA